MINRSSDYNRADLQRGPALAGLRVPLRLLGLAFVPMLLGGTKIPEISATRHNWSGQAARALADYIEQIDRQGLTAGDYAPAALRQAAETGDSALIDAAANRSFALLARDLAQGHIPPGRRGRNFIVSDAIDAHVIAGLIDRGLAQEDVAAVLDALAPQDAQYRGLKAALAELRPDQGGERCALRANLERLRWMPRSLGKDRIMVNVPEYMLHFFREDREVASFRIIVGKPSTPTPQFSSDVAGVILNPPWQVPSSIITEGIGTLVRKWPRSARARGYVWHRGAGGLQITQLPGPQNALGQVKLDMPNPFKVYVHDTPDKQLFERDQRALSHGCIRTDRARELAAMVLGMADPVAIDSHITHRTTLSLPVAKPLPIHVVYQTALAQADGSVRYLGDPYMLDPAVMNELGGPDAARACNQTVQAAPGPRS